MSQENVELTRVGVEALSAGDLEGFIAVCDPAVEFESYLASLSGRGTAYHGHGGLRRYMRDIGEVWEYFHVDIQDYRDGDEVVVALGSLRARGRASGVAVERPLAWVVTWVNAKVTQVQVFTDSAKALEAAGLQE